MSRSNIRVLFPLLLALTSLQVSSAFPADSSTGKTQEHKLVEKTFRAAMPSAKKFHELRDETVEPQSIQRRWFMKKPGLIAPESRDIIIHKKPGSELTENRKMNQKPVPPEVDSEAEVPENFVQKRWYMSGRGDGDTSQANEQRQPSVPERRGSQVTHEKRGYQHFILPKDDSEKFHSIDLKTMLIMRDRVKDLHEKLDEAIDKYGNSDQSMGKAQEPDDPKSQEWNELLKGFAAD